MPKTLIAAALLGLVGAFAVPAAQASVIPLGPAEYDPAGIGTVSTILSFDSQGNASDETARIIYNGSTSVTSSLDNPAGAAEPGVDTTQITGGNNNQTRTFAELGVTDASDLRVFLNIHEPNTAGDVLLRSLIFTAYDPSGTAVFTASLAGGPLNLPQVGIGIGEAGYLFGLDNAQASQLQAVFAPTLRLGLESSISNATGGFETFFAGSARTLPPEEGPNVSEPGTLALLGLALGGLGFLRRKKRA